MNCARDDLITISSRSPNSPRTTRSRCVRWSVAAIMCSSLALTSGCIGMFANLIHAGWGNRVEAEFDGLAERQVAVVCVSQNSAFGPSSAANEIARGISQQLAQAVPDITLVKSDVIHDWIDRNGWNEIDFRELGNGVDAEMVVAVNLMSFSLHDGKTLYKGKSDVNIRVFDLTEGGQVAYETDPPQIQYPKIAGVHTTDMSESDFRRLFIKILSQKIARHFYAYDFVDEFGSDATSMR